MVCVTQCHKGLGSHKVTYASRAEIIVEMVANDLIEVTRKTAATLGGDSIFILLIMHFFALKSYLNILDRAAMLNVLMKLLS